MRVLLVGCGSIGLRHAANLRTLGVRRIVAVDIDPARRAAAEERGVETRSDIAEALTDGPDLTIVATPPSSHLGVAHAAAAAGSHLFIEKPLAHSLAGLEDLMGIVRERRLLGLVGCNMRFHHGPATIKRLLDEGAIGTVVSATFDAGQYLPDWHPELDYRRSYSAREDLGGGVVLDGIHEFDYARWLFGEVRAVAAFTSRRARLDIGTESAADVLLEFTSGVNASIHVDYVQRSYARTCKVIGDEGTIVWDISSNPVWWYSPSRSWQAFDPPPGYSINDMYVDEMRHLLRCLAGTETPQLTIPDAARVLEIALAARDSAASRRVHVWDEQVAVG